MLNFIDFEVFKFDWLCVIINPIEKIKTIFNQGVTIWHTTDVGNYSLNNDEI